MVAPYQQLTIRDPGLGLVGASDARFVYLGCASKGALNTIVPLTSPAAVEDTFGDGPLPEALALALSLSGGPVYGCRLAATVVGTAGTVLPARVGTSTGTVTVAGAPYDGYQVLVEILSTGTVGVATFRYSLDKGRTFSPGYTIPLAGVYSIARTSLTVTFVPGAGPVMFERGDVHAFDTTAPHYTGTELALGCDAVTAFLSVQPAIEFDVLVFTGRNLTGTAAATLAGALGVKLDGFENSYHYMRAIIDMGSGDTPANILTAWASFAHRRISPVYGDAVTPSAKGYTGFGAPLTPLLRSAAAFVQGQLVSTDPAAYVVGPLPVLAISYDEFVSALLDDAKASTARTWPGASGFYITNMRLKSPAGSDYEFWQDGRVMDLACRTTIKAQYPFMSAGFATNPNGTIEEGEARTCEAGVYDQLRAQLLDPKRLNGKRGHVSAVEYVVDRENQYALTRVLQTSVAIRGLTYAKVIKTSIGFSLNVGG
jgi:Protein of unknown function (DUF2586)